MEFIDNLSNDRSKLLRMPDSEKAFTEAILQKKCKSCRNYTFYHCNATNKACGPEGTCEQPTAYSIKGE
jgi:hypothetical protein